MKLSTGLAATGHGKARHEFVPTLHGLRGALAAWVVFYHTSGDGFGHFRVTSYGFLAVDMFFIMSGFVLMQAHHHEFLRLRRRPALRFLQLRWWRTYPLWIVCLLLSLALYPVFKPGPPTLPQILASLLLLDPWALPGISIDTPVWSLGVEWVGYLAFPLVAVIAGATSARLAIWAIVALIAIESAVLVHGGYGKDDTIFGLPALLRMGCGFVAGCMLFRAHQLTRRPGRRLDDVGLAASALLMTGLLLALPLYYVLPALMLVIHFTARSGPLTGWLLNNRPALFLGRISFALYLCHYPIVRLGMKAQALHPGLAMKIGASLGVYVAAFGLATLFCMHVEEPFRRFGRNRVNGQDGRRHTPVAQSAALPHL